MGHGIPTRVSCEWPWLRVCVAAVLVLGLGCNRQADAVPSGPAFTVLFAQPVLQVDPRMVTDTYGIKASRLLFASLVRVDADTLELVLDLAESFEQTAPLIYRVRLRSGLRFADGSALLSDDVVATYKSIVDPALGSPFAPNYKRIAEVRAVDPLTVEFRLSEPHATLYSDLEMPIIRAEDAGHVIGVTSAAIGAGPYQLTRASTGRLHLQANPFWFHGRPRFEQLDLVTVRDDNTRVLRFLAGGADVAIGVIPPLMVPMFEADKRFVVTSRVGVGTTYIGFHTELSPVSDVRVRRALAMALDRQTLMDSKFQGRAELARSWIPPGHWAYASEVPLVGYNVAGAKRLLDEAGYRDPDGDGPQQRFTLTLRTGSDRYRLSIARAMVSMFAGVGVRVEVRPSETATLLADLNQGHFEMTLLQMPEVFEPNVLETFFHSKSIPGRGEGKNRWRYSSPALDAALNRGRQTSEREARRAAYVEAQQILARDLPVVPLWHEHAVMVTSARVGAVRTPRDARISGQLVFTDPAQ